MYVGLTTKGVTMKRVYNPAVQSRIEQFAMGVEAMIKATYIASYPASYAGENPRMKTPKISIDWGIKNAKIVRCDGEGKPESVFCFVDLENGNILKADGWKKPAPQPRGSVMKEDFGVGDVTAYGARYMK